MPKKFLYLFCLLLFWWQVNPTQAKPKLPEQKYTYCEMQKDIVFCVDEKNRPLTGKRYQYWDDGNLKSIESFKNGYRNGLCTFMNEHSIITERAYYKNGIKNGMDKYYYDNNTIKYLANYDNGVLDGRLDVYLKNGDLQGRMTYKKGYLQRGYCINHDGKKENFTRQQIQDHPYNHIKTCGA